MSFTRQAADNWHLEIPGARWFKADLHVHTIDDRAGGRAKMPSGLSGDPEDPNELARYARRFLRDVVASGVQVVGLTPHSPRVGSAPETSAVWRIVEEWNSGTDEDGTPFRKKIYAVLPGFEPALKEGREGLHLLFLFDPEIGRDCYLRMFDLAMGGVTPWRGETLQISSKTTREVFDELHELRDRDCPEDADGLRAWNYLVLAPHIDAPKGLLALKAQVLALFEHGEVAALELGDEKLPEETLTDRPWLRDGMAKHRQAFFHGSDAYSLSEIGRRHTWIKMASPRIEALRQAFIASDSRVRIGFRRSDQGKLEPVANPPDVTLTNRPWLKSVTVRGGASFFGGDGEGPRETQFLFSPDLTCIVGGSMTGKSTLLDGLRMHSGAQVPEEKAILEQVEARGHDRFLAGSPEVTLDCPGRDSTAPLHERWPAVFFAQNELQQLSLRPGAVENILARLVPTEAEEIESRTHKLSDLDDELLKLVSRLAELNEQAGDAAQAEERATKARDELSAFSEAGVENLHRASRDHQTWREGQYGAAELQGKLAQVLESAAAFEAPEITDELAGVLQPTGVDKEALKSQWNRITANLRAAVNELAAWLREARRITEAASKREENSRIEVEQRLAARGFDASRLKEFQVLHQQAALLSSYEANRKEVDKQMTATERRFDRLRKERRDLMVEQRQAFDRVVTQITRDFEGRIGAGRTNCGRTKPLERFLHGLAQRGVTRWWNDLAKDRQPDPEILLAALEQDGLSARQMSPAVQVTFRESMTKARKWELAAIRCPDLYHLELRLEDGSYRRLDELSGGQRVSVLLSLLLETADDRPLVIDQPEDELDSRFLFTTVLPALKRLKGRRQVIVATHNANIVVNGDADMVTLLEATAHHGRVACSGAIEEPAVRDAIVRTVDGGRDAFRLRRLKYGF